jgi:hypothetical protein
MAVLMNNVLYLAFFCILSTKMIVPMIIAGIYMGLDSFFIVFRGRPFIYHVFHISIKSL